MFDGQKIREIIKERKYQAYELDDEWDYGIEKCREKMVELIITNINESISFIKNDCTDEELYWMS